MKKEQAYRYIKTLIIDGTWAPDMAINVNEISEQLKISRTPIHKALSQLEQEGFVSIVPQVGVYVKRPDHHEVMERLLVCASLDALMTEQAASRIEDEELSYLEKTLIEMDHDDLSQEQYSTLNIKFHRSIYKASKLEFAFQLAKQLWDYLHYVGSPEQLFTQEKRQQSQAEHWTIYYCLKDRNQKMAKTVMENHMLRVVHFVSKKYQNTASG